MAHFEYNNMFHAKVLLHKVHALRPRLVSIGVIMRAVQPFEHVSLEMSQKVGLVAQVIWSLLQLKVLADIDCPLSSGCNIIDVAISCQHSQTAVRYISLPLIRGENKRSAIVEVHADRAIRQGVTHPVFVAVIHPSHNKIGCIRYLTKGSF